MQVTSKNFVVANAVENILAAPKVTKMDGDDFEVLEADQLAVQGMLASRYIAQFQTECDAWRESLNM